MSKLLVIISIDGTINNMTKKNDYNKQMDILFYNLKNIQYQLKCDEVALSLYCDDDDFYYIKSIVDQITPLVVYDTSIYLAEQIYGERSVEGLLANSKKKYNGMSKTKKILSLIKQTSDVKSVIYIDNNNYNDTLITANEVHKQPKESVSIILGMPDNVNSLNNIWNINQNINGLNESLEQYSRLITEKGKEPKVIDDKSKDHIVTNRKILQIKKKEDNKNSSFIDY